MAPVSVRPLALRLQCGIINTNTPEIDPHTHNFHVSVAMAMITLHYTPMTFYATITQTLYMRYSYKKAHELKIMDFRRAFRCYTPYICTVKVFLCIIDELERPGCLRLQDDCRRQTHFQPHKTIGLGRKQVKNKCMTKWWNKTDRVTKFSRLLSTYNTARPSAMKLWHSWVHPVLNSS